MPIIPDASMLGAAWLKEAHAYWASKRGRRPMPRRRDIDPVESPTLLPYLMLIDVLSDPLDFRYRLIGGEVHNISNGNYTGKRSSELPGKGRGSIIWDTCEQTVLARSPFSLCRARAIPARLRKSPAAALRGRCAGEYDPEGHQL